MDMLGFGGSILSAGASLLGSKMSADAAGKAARINAISQAQTNQMVLENAALDRDLQREFAQNGVSWKMADARAAGISPLVALGAQTHSYSPVSVGSIQAPQPGSSGNMGAGVAQFGQDISRAINATRSEDDKQIAFTETTQKLALQRAELENQLLASQIAKVSQAGGNPPLPTATSRYMVDGQSGSGPARGSLPTALVKDEPLKRTTTDPLKPGQEPGAITDRGFARGPKSWSTVMSKDVQERLEEDWWGTTAWNLRNRVPKVLQIWENKDTPFPAPAGKEWFTNAFGDFRLRNIQRPASEGRSLFRRKSR